MRRVTHERYISQSQRANCDLARRYVGLNLSQQGLDGGPFEKLFLTMLENIIGQKPGKSSSSILVRQHRNRSGVVELIGREPLMFARVENGVTKSCQIFRRKNRKNA